MIIVVGILYRLGMEHYLPWAEQRSWVYLWLRNVIKEVNLEEKLPNRGQFSFLRDMTTLKQELPWGGIHRSDARLWMTRYASEDPPSPQSHRPHDAPRLPGRHLTPPTAAGSCSSPASGLPPGDGPSEIHRAWAPWSSHHRTYPQRPSHKALTGLRVRQSGPSWEGPGSWSLTRAAGATGNLISPSFESILTQGTTKKAQRRPGLLREAPTLNLWRRWPSGEPTFQLTSGTPGCRLPGAVTVTPSGGREAGPPFSKEEPFDFLSRGSIIPDAIWDPQKSLRLSLLNRSWKMCISWGTGVCSGEKTSLLEHWEENFPDAAHGVWAMMDTSPSK